MKTAITDIPGIGQDTAKVLMESGFKSLQDIAGTSIDNLAAVQGFGPIRAGRVIHAANDVNSEDADDDAKPAQPATTVRRTAPKPAAKPASTATSSKETKEDTAAKKLSKKEQEKLKKAKKAAEKKAKKAKKAAEKKAKKAKKAKKDKK